MNARLLVLLVTFCLCGCETIPLLYLGEVAHDVVDTQLHLHKPPWYGKEPASPPPTEPRQTSSRNASDTPAGHPPARATSPGHTDASTSGENRTNPDGIPEGSSTPPSPYGAATQTVLSELAPPAPSAGQFVMDTALASLWKDYRGFQYEAVLRNAHAASMQPGITPRKKALALMLAGSSAYILGNQSLAREILAMAASIAPDVRPNPDVFPGEVCRIYEKSIPSKP